MNQYALHLSRVMSTTGRFWLLDIEDRASGITLRARIEDAEFANLMSNAQASANGDGPSPAVMANWGRYEDWTIKAFPTGPDADALAWEHLKSLGDGWGVSSGSRNNGGTTSYRFTRYVDSPDEITHRGRS